MTIEEGKKIQSLVNELEMLTNHYEKIKYFRDHRKRWTLEIETDSRRSGTFELDLEESVVVSLFNKKLEVTAGVIKDIKNEIEKLK